MNIYRPPSHCGDIFEAGEKQERILIGQLGSNGDVLYTTTLARQLRHDNPDAYIVWAISSQCRHLLANNPDIDYIWEWKVAGWESHEAAWYSLERAILELLQLGSIDRAYLSQIWPSNFQNFDGTIRPSILRAYGSEITVPIESTINLTAEEIENTHAFIASNGLRNRGNRILFECSSKSGQSYVSPQFAAEVAAGLAQRGVDCSIIISTHEQVPPAPNIISARELGMRENAALTDACDLFVGCGSGLSVVATSPAARVIPNLQILKGSTSYYASFLHDFEYFGKDASRFLEMADIDAQQAANAIAAILESGVDSARREYAVPVARDFSFYISLIRLWLLERLRFAGALNSVWVTAERYGWDDQLLSFARREISPMALADPACGNARTREAITEMLDQLSVI